MLVKLKSMIVHSASHFVQMTVGKAYHDDGGLQVQCHGDKQTVV